MKKNIVKIVLFYFTSLTLGQGQNLYNDNLKLLFEYSSHKDGFTKKGIINYPITPFKFDGKNASWWTTKYSNPSESDLNPIELIKGDTVNIVSIREGTFNGKYQKWVAIEIEYSSLPENTENFDPIVIVPYQALQILSFQFYKLNEEKEPFELGDTLMVSPFKESNILVEQELGLIYPQFVVKNNKRYGLFYKVGFKDLKQIKLNQNQVDFLESLKAKVELRNNTYNDYLYYESKQKEKLFNMSILILLVLGTILLIYWIIKQSKKGVTKSIDLVPIKHEKSISNLREYLEAYFIAQEQFAKEKLSMTTIQIEKAEKLWNQKWLLQDFRRKNLVIEALVKQIGEFGATLKVDNFDFDGKNYVLNINYNYSYVKNSSYTTGGTTFRDFDGNYKTIGSQTYHTSKVISKKDLKSLLKYNIGDKMVCTGNMKSFSINSHDNPPSVNIVLEYHPIYF